jgi:uncharacterized phage protein (TIGR02220 family)/predicted phage replisome organizer
MAETHKYYWLKLKRDFFKRHDVKIIESQENGKDYLLFYLKLLVEAIDHEGSLRFSDTIPYDEKMLATITDTNIDVVRSACAAFSALGMMERLEDGTIFMAHVEKMIGSETSDAIRMREVRARAQIVAPQEKGEHCSKPFKKRSPELEKEIDIELEKEIEKEIDIELEKNNIFEQIPFKEIIEYLNGKVNRQYRNVEANKKLIRARFNEGYTLQDFKDVIDKKCIEWSNTEMSKYLRPQTLFGTKFDSYLNQEVKSKRNNYDAMIFDENGMLIE